MHTASHLKIDMMFFRDLSLIFPGVSVFFLISGFLISKSFESRINKIPSYIKSRLLRIYPGLYVCFLLTYVVLGICGYLNEKYISQPQFSVWLVSQLTVFQFYNPEHFRSFGVGTVNGSLWTIPIEISFYAVLPFLILAYNKLGNRRGNIFFLFLAISSFGFEYWLHSLSKESLVTKLLSVSLIPHLYMFVIGSLFYKNFLAIGKLVANKVLKWTLIYVTAFALFLVIDSHVGNSVFSFFSLLLTKVLLSFWVLSIAFSHKTISKRILNHQDISYGVYIYHMVVVNIFIRLGLVENMLYLLAVLLISYLLGFLSWKFIESKALGLKA
jgi:peptidoglycan/LPS O-acetylase OafA/YrhL